MRKVVMFQEKRVHGKWFSFLIACVTVLIASCGGGGDSQQPSARVRGQIVSEHGQLLQNAVVRIGNLATTTDMDGRFLLQGVAAEPQEIFVAKDGYESYRQILNLPASDYELPIIRLKPSTVAARVFGRVVSPFSQQPIARARVAMGEQATYTDERGQFWLHLRAEGIYFLTIQADGFFDLRQEVEVVPGDNVLPPLELNPLITVRGVIQDETGRGVSGIRVIVLPNNASGVSAQNGRFSIRPSVEGIPTAFLVDLGPRANEFYAVVGYGGRIVQGCPINLPAPKGNTIDVGVITLFSEGTAPPPPTDICP